MRIPTYFVNVIQAGTVSTSVMLPACVIRRCVILACETAGIGNFWISTNPSAASGFNYSNLCGGDLESATSISATIETEPDWVMPSGGTIYVLSDGTGTPRMSAFIHYSLGIG